MSVVQAGAAETKTLDLRPVKKWLASQEKIRSLRADFTQTRAFRSLENPFVSTGTFWFQAPVSFRVELGDPPKMVSLRKKDTIYLIQPQKKRAELHAVDELKSKTNPALFKFPIAKDYDDFARQFELRDVTVNGSRAQIEVMPRDPSIRKVVTWAKFDFDTEAGRLYSVEMAFKDGTSMRNEFSNVQINPKVDPALFDYDLKGYQVSGGRP